MQLLEMNIRRERREKVMQVIHSKLKVHFLGIKQAKTALALTQPKLNVTYCINFLLKHHLFFH